MATLIAYADGNLTGSTTFKASETGTGALTMIRNTTVTLSSNSNQSSPSFTITNGSVIEGVLLWVATNGIPVAGTVLVELQKSAVTQASVTVNAADLPNSQATNGPAVLANVPIFFKFTATATGDGTANWTIKITCSLATQSQISYSKNSATAGDFTKALRTSTTATPAAADDLYIVGELTGAGTHNSRTVTMDSTATTQYGNGSVNSTSVNGGGIRVSNYATLIYGTSASTNYYLAVKGDLEVFWNGTLTIGATGSEIPRSSTAVLEFVMASANGDFGLLGRNLSTVNMAGLSRTSGKNIVKCKLTSDISSSSNTLTGITSTGLTSTGNAIGADGVSALAWAPIENSANSTHSAGWTSSPTITNTTQTATVWLARGTGANNRFVRLYVGNSGTPSAVTNGFFADIDLQAGTIGTCTAIGNGTGTSATITAVGGGYMVRMTGIASSGALAPQLIIAMCSAAGTVTYTGSGVNTIIYDHVALVTAASISDTTLNLDTDTGWLSGDNIIVASTTRTPSECEIIPLNANAGASSATTALYLLGSTANGTTVSSHSGTAPTQAEVGLVTRNVKIRSNSTTLFGYVYMESLNATTISWCEFYYLGFNNAVKSGLTFAAANLGTTTAKSVSYCSMHDTFNGFRGTGSSLTSLNYTLTYSVFFNQSNIGCVASDNTAYSTGYATDYTLDNLLVMKAAVSAGIWDPLYAATITNCTVVGTNANAFVYATGAGTLAMPLGTFSGNTAHSNNGTGIHFGNSNGCAPIGTASNLVSWRNAGRGILIGQGEYADLILNNITLFGNTTSNIQLLSDAVTIYTGVLAGDTSFATTYGISVESGMAGGNPSMAILTLYGVDMSGVGTGLAPHTTEDIRTDFWNTNWMIPYYGTFVGCNFGAPLVISAKNNWSPSAHFDFERFKNVAGDHRCEMKYGQARTDATIYHTAAPSQRLTPNSTTKKLESAPKSRGILVAVAYHGSVSIAVWIRRSQASEGGAYNGNQPRLIVRRNDAIGLTADTVLATGSSAVGTWEKLSATVSVSPTDAGALEFIVDCDGTQGWINVDDWARS